MKSSENTMSDETKRMLFEAFIKTEYPPLMNKALENLTKYITDNRGEFEHMPEETVFSSLVTSLNYLYITNLQVMHESEAKVNDIMKHSTERLQGMLALDYSTSGSEEQIHALILAHLRVVETHLINLLVNKKEEQEG